MTKVDIYSGFLGAGKTTLIKKMISEGYKGEKLALIENEFGEIGVDGGFLQDAGINIKEMNSGCICCSLVGDFGIALKEIVSTYAPDRIIIEPTGVGKLSDVIGAVNRVADENLGLGNTVAVVDANKVAMFMKNFGEFFNNQIETASTIMMSRTDTATQQKLDKAVAMLREHNPKATIVTTPWDQLTGAQIREAMEGMASLAQELAQLQQETEHHHHDDECCDHEHHHHHDHDEECCHDHEHHHHHDHDEECCHDHEHHHHHDHDEECCHDHEHHHHHDEECCHDHEHHHHHEDGHCCCGHDHHHHHADEVFTSWGVETHKKFTLDAVNAALKELDSGKYGIVLRAKGIVPAQDGSWIHFDFVPEEENVRLGGADVTGKLCVIGSKLDEDGLAALFGV